MYVCTYIYEKRTKNRDKSYKEKQDNKPNQINSHFKYASNPIKSQSD